MTRIGIRYVGSAALQRPAKKRKESPELDIALASNCSGRPHYEQATDCTASTVESICSGNCLRGRRRIPRLALHRQVEKGVPSWLADSATDDRR